MDLSFILEWLFGGPIAVIFFAFILGPTIFWIPGAIHPPGSKVMTALWGLLGSIWSIILLFSLSNTELLESLGIFLCIITSFLFVLCIFTYFLPFWYFDDSSTNFYLVGGFVVGEQTGDNEFGNAFKWAGISLLIGLILCLILVFAKIPILAIGLGGLIVFLIFTVLPIIEFIKIIRNT